MAEMNVRFCLPDSRRAEFVSDYGFAHARIFVDGALALALGSKDELDRGVPHDVPGLGRVTLRATEDFEVRLWIDDVEAPREDRVRLRPSASAWRHAWLAFSGSAAGFIASWLYLRRAEALHDPWALKMAMHMAAWHLLLTLTLFPLSVWGQRFGIRIVQGAALVFFLIHLSIALANTGADVRTAEGPWIAMLNALSGMGFFAAVIYGQRAHRDMTPKHARRRALSS